jgi:tyrosinase
VLFPTWHRVYLLRLEDALRSIRGCEDVTLPYWDETSEDSLAHGVPWALTNETYVLDGKEIPNPLKSFVLNRSITDNLKTGDLQGADYSKPLGYETVRYPLSGLVGTPQDREATAAHNKDYRNPERNTEILNGNVTTWLNSQVELDGKTWTPGGGVHEQYANCLDAPNYTVFSNTTSSKAWCQDNGASTTSLEQPHNAIHLAVGGFDVPSSHLSLISGANGDMGENDTAALDPIFYFHHCFIDRVFWLWQQRHGATDRLELIPEYPGSNSVDGQTPAAGVAAGIWLDLNSPLDPFRLTVDGQTRPYTSLDCINIERQLGYTYGPGSDPSALPARPTTLARGEQASPKVVRVSGINRNTIRGSFVVAAYARIGGERQLIGIDAILSRWHVAGCANCQAHVEVKAFFGLGQLSVEAANNATIEVELHTRDGVVPPPSGQLASNARPPFRVEII